MSKLEVDAIEPQSGTTITIGASGDTVNLVGTLQTNGSPLPGDISSVVAGTGLTGGGTSGDVTLNVVGGTGITANANDIAIDNTVATLDGSQTLTNKSIVATQLTGTIPTARLSGAYTGITSLGTITTFRSTGIDDNSNALAITIDSSEHTHFGLTSSPSAGQGGVSILNYGTIQTSRTATGNLAHHEYYNPNGQVGNIKTSGSDLNINASSSLTFYTNNAEKMRILAGGNVGIGTTNPTQKLDILGTNNVLQDIKTSTSTGIGGIQIKGSNTNSYLKVFHLGPSFGGTTFGGATGNNQSLIEAQGASSLAFTTQGNDSSGITPDIIFAPARTARMIIKNNGNVGIGTNAPAHNLEIVTTASGSVNDSLQIKNSSASSGTGSRIRFINSTDSTSDANGASISCVRIGGDNDLVFETENSEAMRIDHVGNVGIGKTNPGEALDVVGTVRATTGVTVISSSIDSNLRLQNSATGSGTGDGLLVQAYGNDAYINNYENGDMYFRTNNTNRLQISSAGSVGIGTTSPAGKLDVAGTIIGDGLQIDGNAVIQTSSGDVSLTIAANENGSNREPSLNLKGANSSSNPVISFGDSNGYPGSIQYENADNSMQFGTNSSEKLRITSAGSVGIGNTSPVSKLTVTGQITATGGAVSAPTYAFDNDTDTGISRPTTNAINFVTAGSERMRINAAGKILINTTIDSNGNVCSSGNGTSGSTACYGLVRGSYKSTLGMDSVGNMNIRNFSGEIYVTDAAGNNTTISPHNFSVIPDGASEDLAWSYYARKGDTENDFDNTKYISADITKVIRKVENLTGDKLIYTGTGNTDDGSTVSQNIIQDLITKIESLEAKVTQLENA